MPKFPERSKFGTYILCQESGGFVIRQQVTTPDGKRHFPRYPKGKYDHIHQSREVMQAFVDRLNYGLDLKKQRILEIQTAFVPEKIMESFRAKLQTDTPSAKDFRYSYNTLFQRYFLNYFIGHKKLLDPREWVKAQADWGAALVSKAQNPDHNVFERKLSAKTIKSAIQVANRFMKFLHLQMPEEYPALVFQPLGRGALKTYSAELKIERAEEPIGKFIPNEDWTKIDEKLPAQIGCFIRLMYHYGLRRAESLGFTQTTAVRKDFLQITQQLKFNPSGIPVYSILKDKEQRNTPHWFSGPDLAYKWITEGLEKKMHPDTLSERWDDFALGLGMTYKLHDFRRTFITRALRKHEPRDVQLAVGHANLSTTMKYAQDDRKLGDGVWTPGNAS